LATVTVRYISGIPIAHKSLESIKLDFETFKWVYTITPSIVYSIIIIIIILKQNIDFLNLLNIM